MLANTIKTKVMVYGRMHHERIKLYMDGKLIDQVEKYKSLGVIFNSIRDKNGNIFKHNTEHLNNKARSAIFGIQKKLKPVGPLPANQMLYLYETLVQPIILYGSDIWGAFPNSTKKY